MENTERISLLVKEKHHGRRFKTKKDVITDETESKEVETVGGSSSSVKKKSFWTENRIEIIVAILLGATALLTVWATWIGSLHGGNQSTNYTKSNNIAAEGNSEYNAGVQLYLSDIMTWNTIMDYSFELAIAESENDKTKAELIENKLETYANRTPAKYCSKG